MTYYSPTEWNLGPDEPIYPAPQHPKLVAAFCYRYEPDWLIDQACENLAWVDEIITVDTSRHPDLWVPRRERLTMMQEAARKAKADWVLHIDPDERLEDRAEKVIRRALSRPKFDRYALRMWELWSPTEYRVDGVWGEKWRRRLYRLGCDPKAPIGRLNVNIYHLATAEPVNRTIRRRVHTDHNSWDNRRRGFDYLDDESGLVTEPIPKGRGFHPPYRRYIKQVPGYEPT